MKKNILYKIILIAGLIFTATILNAENPVDPPKVTEAPLDSMMFLPITVAVGLVVFMTKRKKNKNE